MKHENEGARRGGGRSAAQWYVEVDAGPLDDAGERRLADWIEQRPTHGDELARCAAAVRLAKALGEEGAFADAARDDLPATRSSPAGYLQRSPAWYRRAAPAWAVAALSLVVAVLAVADRFVGSRPEPGSASPGAAMAAGGLTIDVGATQPVVVLPNEIVVDAGSVAVLPFGVGDTPDGRFDEVSAIAAALYDEVVRQLAETPGIYVVGRQAAGSYLGLGLMPEEVAAQLGVRSVVEARVAFADGRVQVVLSLTDAARDARLLEDAFERPLAELTAMRTDIVTNIAVALAGSREPMEPTAPIPQ